MKRMETVTMYKNSVKNFSCLTAALLLSVSFVACSKGGKKSGGIQGWEKVVMGKGPEDNAHKGGTLTARLSTWPKALNYHTVSDGYIGFISYFTHISLLSGNEEDLSLQPLLAKKWKVGADKKTYTFYLDPDAVWPDGKPITSEDVKWSFEKFWNKKECTLCEPIRQYYGPVTEIQAPDAHTVIVKTERVHFANLDRFGSLYVLPKHRYQEGNFDRDYDKKIFGGGPYYVDAKETKFHKKIVLKRNKRWWANKYDLVNRRFNFDKIVLRYVKDAAVAHEMFKRKEFDLFYYELDTLSYWDDQSKEPFTNANNAVVTAEMFNPSTWGGVALNMRKGVLKEKKFRKALQLLMNRELMMNKIFKGHVRPTSGPFMRGTEYSKWKGRAPVPFNPKKAESYLIELGFTQTNSDGVRFREVMEDGKKVKQLASVEIMYSLDTHAQWITVMKEDAKKVGIEIKPRIIEWSAATKKLDEFKFDAFVISWMGSPIPAPEQLFHGRTAESRSSSNIPGLNHKRLNDLIDKGPAQFDQKKRYALYHQIEKIIIDEQPYIFRWTQKLHKVSYWKDRVDPTATPFFKFSGSHLRDPFFFHWRAVKAKPSRGK